MSSAINITSGQIGNAFVINCSSNKIIEKKNEAAIYLCNRTPTKPLDLNYFSVNKMCNNGRWTDLEHLIFLACIIQFGRDWVKIEFYVRTRSSSQARSHAQKVLKKMDRSAIFKEISLLKSKLNFKPKEHGCEGLTFLNDDKEEIQRLMESKRVTKRVKIEEDNDEVEVDSKKAIARTPCNDSTNLIQYCQSVEKEIKNQAATPKTCCSSPATPIAQIINSICSNQSEKNALLSNCDVSVNKEKEKKKTCFRNLNFNMIEPLKAIKSSIDKEVEFKLSNQLMPKIKEEYLNIQMESDDDMFDFDLYHRL